MLLENRAMKKALRVVLLSGLSVVFAASFGCQSTTRTSTALPAKLTSPSDTGNLQAENDLLRARIDQLESELRQLRATQNVTAAAPGNASPGAGAPGIVPGSTTQPDTLAELYAEGNEEWMARDHEIDQEIDAQQANLSAVNSNRQLSKIELNLDSQNIQANIDALRAQKDQLQQQKGKYLPTLKSIQLGAMGMLRDNCQVFQLIDRTDVLVKRGTEVLWFKNVDASGLTEGSPLQIDEPVQVVGTKDYQTNSGRTATVYVLQPISLGTRTQ
jgi:hypothetical protein